MTMAGEIVKYWNPQEVTFLIQAYEKGAKASDIAKALGRSMNSINKKCQGLIGDGILTPKIKKESDFKGLEFKPIEQERHVNFLRLTGDAISVSDVHVPFWDKRLLSYMLETAKKFVIKQLVINGDWLNMDSFSHWVTGFRGRKETETELLSASYYLVQCLKVFKKIYITSGNHEDRLFKILEGQIPHHTFLKMITDDDRVIKSDYSYCDLGDTIRIVHPKNYGDRGGVVPTDLADKYEKHIISGHNHQWGIQVSKNGKWLGIDQGMGGDPEKIEYHQKSITRNRTWQQGFTLIKNYIPTPLNLRHTNWKLFLSR